MLATLWWIVSRLTIVALIIMGLSTVAKAYIKPSPTANAKSKEDEEEVDDGGAPMGSLLAAVRGVFSPPPPTSPPKK